MNSDEIQCPYASLREGPTKCDYIHASNAADRQVTPGLRFSIPEIAQQACRFWAKPRNHSTIDQTSSQLVEIPWLSRTAATCAMLPLNPEKVFRQIHTTHGLSAELVSPLGQRYQAHADPVVIQHVLDATDGAKGQLYRKAYPLIASWRGLGGNENTIASHGDAWRSRNRITRRYISSRMLDEPRARDQMQLSAAHLRKLLDRQIASGSGSLDISLVLGATAIKTAVQTLYGFEIDEARAFVIRQAARRVLGFCAIESFVPVDVSLGEFCRLLPLPALVHLRRARKHLNALVDDLMQSSQASRNRRSILLDFSSSIDASTGKQIDQRLVREETHFQILAVAETVPTWVSWTLAALSKDPIALSRVKSEIDAKFDGDVASHHDLTVRLPLSQLALREAGRLYTPKFTIVRRAMQDDQIRGADGEVRVEKGTFMFLNCSVAHRLERYFGSSSTGFAADVFALDRLSPSNLERRGMTGVRLPHFFFGGASRICSGRAFASWEALAMLATIIKHFDFRIAHPGSLDSRRASDFTLRMSGGFQFQFTRRGDAS